jgi:DNA polymerase-1
VTEPKGRVANAIGVINQELRSLLSVSRAVNEMMTEKKLKQVFELIDMPLVPILAAMELSGLPFNPKTLNDIENMVTFHLDAIKCRAHEMVDEPFNLASPDQVAYVLFEKLQLHDCSNQSLNEGIRHSKKGKHRSTAEEDLKRISHLHPIIGLILNHRFLSKLKSTYIDAYKPFFATHTTEKELPRIQACWK